MILYRQGNIFDSKAHCLVNPVNCIGVMGGGLALQFKHHYPVMFGMYAKLCAEQQLDIGKIAFWHPPEIYNNTSQIICLFPTKYHWRNPSTVEIVEAGLRAYIEYAVTIPITSVAFPQLGCGLGGLDFKMQVEPLMIKYLGALPYPVEIYVP